MRKWLVAILSIILLFSLAIGCAKKTEAPKKRETEKEATKKPESKIQPEEQKASVTRIIDGDTIEVSFNGKTEKVRLIGIDTPEKGMPYFDEAKAKTKELCFFKDVRLVKDVSERDKYGRLLRYVYVENLFVNAELVKQGYANVYTYPPDVKHSELFVKLEREARANNRGLWVECEQAPEESISPHQPLPQSKAQFVGSVNSNKYHYPSCYWAKKINPKNEIWFSSAEDAQAKGYVPCNVCKPPGAAVGKEKLGQYH